MGKLFGNLTNTELADPNSGKVTWSPSPQQVSSTFGQYAQPATATEGGSFAQPSPSPLPFLRKPTVAEAADTGPGGMPNATSPGLTKAGKLATILMGGLKGALAGQAANEQAVVASGGRRSGGIGTGFQAGYQLPWQQAAQRQELGQQQAQTELTRSQAETIQTPQGPMPGWLAKLVYPAQIKAGGQVQAAQVGAQGRVQAAEIGKRFIPVAGVGLYDTSNRSIIPGTQQGITVTPEIAADYQLPDDFIGKPMTLQNLAAVQRSSVFENVPQMTAQGPIIVNRRNATAKPVSGPGGQKFSPPALASPIVVGDVNNPGQTKVVSAGQAISQGAPGQSSASVEVPKAAAKAEIPTKVGDQKVAFNTALQHAQLLEQALTALNNGDVKVLNSLKNRLKTEFGSADMTNFRVISQAYSREITKMLSAGHMTDSEIGSAGATLPTNASPQQILGALQNYRRLAQSKLNQLNQQVQNAVSGSQPTGKKSAPVNANDPLGIR